MLNKATKWFAGANGCQLLKNQFNRAKTVQQCSLGGEFK